MDTFLYLLNGWRNTVVNVGIIMQTHCVYFFSFLFTKHTHTHIPSFLCEVELNGLLRRLIISPFIQPGWNESLPLTHDLVCAVRWRYVWRVTWRILYLSGHVLKVLDLRFCHLTAYSGLLCLNSDVLVREEVIFFLSFPLKYLQNDLPHTIFQTKLVCSIYAVYSTCIFNSFSFSYLVFILGDVGVDLVEGAHAVELAQVESGLLREISTHVLITDGGHARDIWVIPAGRQNSRSRWAWWFGVFES